jgi:hypothetical protein
LLDGGDAGGAATFTIGGADASCILPSETAVDADETAALVGND